MVEVVQSSAESSPNLYTIPHITSALQRKDTKLIVSARKRGEPLGGPHAHYGGFGGAGPSGRPQKGQI